MVKYVGQYGAIKQQFFEGFEECQGKTVLKNKIEIH